MFNKKRRKGERPSKKEINAQEAMVKKREEGQAFINDINAVFARHGKKLEGFIKIDSPQPGVIKGMIADIRIAEFLPSVDAIRDGVNIKPWSECAQENLDLRRDCKHENDKHNIQCKTCGLKTKDYGDGLKGVSSEYDEWQLREIQAAKDEERAKAEKEEGKKDAEHPADCECDVCKPKQ